ncbi:hypothetical protein Mapa_011585 [Marchantia paleacea]|nr:hypothetical protein Mapa_011585 [Marchantia paleacea]
MLSQIVQSPDLQSNRRLHFRSPAYHSAKSPTRNSHTFSNAQSEQRERFFKTEPAVFGCCTRYNHEHKHQTATTSRSFQSRSPSPIAPFAQRQPTLQASRVNRCPASQAPILDPRA